METKRTLPKMKKPGLSFVLSALVLSMLLSSCMPNGRPSDGQPGIGVSGLANLSASPTISPSPTATSTPWPTFAAPLEDMPTPAPDPAKRAELPEDTTVWLLLGAEEEKPVRGRTNAIHLLLVNERLSKTSIISIPGSTYLYLPGYGMGRINTAYPLGGIKLVYDVLGYNFGLWPDRYVVAHETEFRWLVDDLDSLEVSVLYPIRDDCGGLPAGLHSMDGEKTLCYVSYVNDDDVFRTTRQQQVLQLLFTKLVNWGRMAQIPIFYASYIEKLDTDISLSDIILRIPLALRLGDPDRVKSFVLGWDVLEAWQLPDYSGTSVLLPRSGKISQLVDQAIEAISEPSALNAVVLTYEWQLTQVIGQTATVQAEWTRMAMPTLEDTPEPWVEPTVAPPTVTPLPGNTSPPPTATQPATATPRATQAPYPTTGPYPYPTPVWHTPVPSYP